MSSPIDDGKAVFYAQFIAVTYAMFSADETILEPNPIGHGPPNGWDVVGWIIMRDFILGNDERFYGIVAEDEFGNHIVAIRGTGANVLSEWLEDLDCTAIQFRQVPGAGHVARGFDKVYSTMRIVEREPAITAAPGTITGAAVTTPLSGSFGQQMNQLLANRATKRQAMSIASTASPSHIVTGHSLGSALSTLYVMENGSNGTLEAPTICTFASPRVGNSGFVNAFNSLTGLTSWRIVNKPDVVPNLPPDIWGWRHINAEYLFESAKAKATIACAHALQTYVSLLDPSQLPDPDCR